MQKPITKAVQKLTALVAYTRERWNTTDLPVSSYLSPSQYIEKKYQELGPHI